MKKRVNIALFLSLIFAILTAWIFLYTTYWLTCESFKTFDNAKTRMTFPFNCEVSINNEEYQNKNW